MTATASLLALQEDIVLKMPWQQQLNDLINGPVVPRRIIWIWSNASNTGKTTTMKHMMKLKGLETVLAPNNWQIADILYAYMEHKVIHFNLPRHYTDNDTVYTVLESLSDGGVQFCSKYASMQKYVSAHIIVTTNQDPTKCKEMLPERVFAIEVPSLDSVPNP